ncbi:MAG: TIR domain-containing protein [Nitrospirae bacterium]|nr:TIR domain-containing protein [Nitrospirota bacterium]
MNTHSRITQWILVAGTGSIELPSAVYWTSKEIGKAIAQKGYGLIVGGWSGVDYVTAEAFSIELQNTHTPLSDYLIQVVPENNHPQFRGGHVIYVKQGIKEWLEGINYADAVVLLGGEGGTYETYMFAAQEQRPVFSLAATGGDAQLAFMDIISKWNYQNLSGIAEEEYRKVLQGSIKSELDGIDVVNSAMSLIDAYFKKQRQKIFISYSHKDTHWCNKLKTILGTLEHTEGHDAVWADTDIAPGEQWLKMIENALKSSGSAILLVTPNFLSSEFIMTQEMPAIIKAADVGQIRVCWIYLSSCAYDRTEFAKFQAAHDISRPIDQLSPAKQNEILVDIGKEIKAAHEQCI